MCVDRAFVTIRLNTNIDKTMSEINEKCIKVCNELLRGERSAIETYDMAIKKHGDNPRLNELRRIRDEHVAAVGKLEKNIRDMGGEPGDDSGAWGLFAKAVQGTANLFGDESAVESLKKGEEKGLDDYEDALKDEDVMVSCKSLFQMQLIPNIKHHIQTLDRLEDSLD